MISFLVTAWKESKTIGRCINSIANKQFSGIDQEYEILLACPDDETYIEALKVVKSLNLEDKLVRLKDEGKGKPAALNMLLDTACGDILIFTDGDVYFEKDSVKKLLIHFKDKEYVQNDDQLIVTGRPVSADAIDTMMGYFGHLLSDAAHHKRSQDLLNTSTTNLKSIKKRKIFPVSGYIYAMFKTNIRFPQDCLADDGYISYIVYNQGGKIEYAADAIAFVKYPTNLSDYFKQKKRSTGGYIQLWEYGIVRLETKSRSFWKEVQYSWFPLKYAKNLKQLFWSLLLYPIRLSLWLQIYWERKILKKNFVKTWVRIESTK